MDVLLTNDDGIDAAGLGVLYRTLDAMDDVTVTAVAPVDDQSAVGRALNHEVDIQTHEYGYAVDGTPTDCVVAALGALGIDPDIVVSGCNRGANLGEYVLGRSGTVSAAVEAAFFDVPAIAVSLYVPLSEDFVFAETETPASAYALAANTTEYLVANGLDSGVFEHADYLNVNCPVAEQAPAEMVVTRPSHTYDMDAERDGDTIHIKDRIWKRMADGDIPDPEGTDRRTVVDGKVSVSPLTAPHTTEFHPGLDALAAEFGG
ncbi:5'/3'-nucleotidase SurE [Halosegnis rubeus]|jgi:5'-nucleotidase|uniref:5'-nucleotidase SurE n=1 Tax=Halosegnis rubeus TaxID=2212850 RepID=A0A5N5UIV4_9EURY|nr:5'/3'-nucleotidase SurE [Halosegnis rubeus]KAB7513999.1 5'/3'-nucleotidase SurE [Halosegnis rubeus]KAB7514396.1 5'/3'-nucleotidase SurE [Halosegnis rubeus]KAB7518689.1 5'/3'-nucleotidase SurE [Halosegnis rubeus]